MEHRGQEGPTKRVVAVNWQGTSKVPPAAAAAFWWGYSLTADADSRNQG